MALSDLIALRNGINEALLLIDANAALEGKLAAAQTALAEAERTIASLKAQVAALTPPPASVPFVRTTQTVSAGNPHLVFLRAAPVPARAPGIGFAQYLGWTVKPHYLALLFGYLASGDPALIGKLKALMNAFAPELLATALTYPVWESLACSLIALHALILKQHGDTEANGWLTLWQTRYSAGVVGDDQAHTYTAALETNAYLALLTGEQVYADKRDEQIAVVKEHMHTTPDGWLDYNHRMPIKADGSNIILGAVQLNYLRYFASSTLTLREIDIELVAPGWFADSLAARAFRADGKVGFYFDGSLNGTRDFDAAKWSDSLIALLGKWNTKIAAHNRAVFETHKTPALATALLREDMP